MAALQSLILFIVAASALLCVSAGEQKSRRAVIMEKAIAQANEEFKKRAEATAQSNMSPMEKKVRAFKTASREAIAQGSAQLKFERMVKLAEKQLIEEERKAMIQSPEELAQSYAEQVYHMPGSLLTSQEVYEFYDSSGCSDFVTTYDEEGEYCDGYYDLVWRRADGTCNNYYYPFYGAAGTKMSRLVPPMYEDGISRPRGFLQMTFSSLVGSHPFEPPNPSPRIVSLEVIKDKPINDPNNTLMLMQWGQFMDHDLDAMPEYHAEDCTHSCQLNETLEESCLPFPIPNFDLPDSRVADYCHDFRRSLPACEYYDDDYYTTRPREHFNSITHWIDGSTVYQSNPDHLNNHLLGDKGRMIVSSGTGGDFLPLATTQSVVDDIGMGCPNLPCFLAGDFRANEQPGLATMHTLWVREHNRVVELVDDLSCRIDPTSNEPYRNEDKTGPLFNTARHFITSLIQKITYLDYLPRILGQPFWDAQIGDYPGYNPYVKVNIPNAFASAAFRYGHSQVQPAFPLQGPGYTDQGQLELNEIFFQSLRELTANGLDPILRGLVSTPARATDEFINSVLTQQLFTDSPDETGLDLASLNIMRGRDHGIAPYFVWRNWALKACPSIGTIWFRDWHTKAMLYKVYGGLYNIDLFVGALAEAPLPGGVIGPTMGCIVAYTFQALRDGDYFYFENDKVFTDRQIKTIKKNSLAHVICRNTDIKEVPTNVFDMNSPMLDCSAVRGPVQDLRQEMEDGEWNCKFFLPKEQDEMKLQVEKKLEAEKQTATDLVELLGMLQNILGKINTETGRQQAASPPPPTKAPPTSSTQNLSEEEVMSRLESLLEVVKKKKK